MINLLSKEEVWALPQQESGEADNERQVDCIDCPTCQKDISHHVKIRCPEIPFLAPGRMTRANKQFLEGELLEDSKAIATKYSVLIDTTCSSLRERGILVERAVTCLMSIATFFKPVFSNVPLFYAKRDDLAKASSFESVLTSINGYHSWFNTYPLKHLIAVLGTEVDQDRFTRYEHSLGQYMNRRVFKIFQPIYGEVDRSSCSLFVVKLDSSWDDSTIQELVDVKHNLARIVGLQPQALLWSSIDEGCVKLTFSVPSFAVRRIFPLKQLQKAQLLINGVIAFECGDFKFSMIEERVSDRSCECVAFRGLILFLSPFPPFPSHRVYTHILTHAQTHTNTHTHTHTHIHCVSCRMDSHPTASGIQLTNLLTAGASL